MTKKTIAVIENHAMATNTIRRDLMEAIRNHGYELFILTGDSDIFGDLTKEGFNMINLGVSGQNPLHILKYLRTLNHVLGKLKPDVCLTFTIRPAIYGNLITRIHDIQTISNITGIGPLFENNGFSYRMARFLYRYALIKTEKVFFQNFDDQDIFLQKKYVRHNQSKRIPGSGIDFNKYSPMAPSTNAKDFNFLFISRLLVDKGVLDFIEAARIIKSNNSRVRFSVLGPIWNQNLKSNSITEENIESWVDAGLINYLGDTKDVRPFISEADCVVLPSYREGTSNVLLESASMAKPLIATNVTGCKEIIDDGLTGFLCEVKNPKDLAEKMYAMYKLSYSERRNMGIRGREKVIKEFDKNIVISEYLKGIKEIISK